MTEADLQEQVADYLRLAYPDVLFHSDFGSGVKLTMGQAVKQKRQNGGRRAWPDMFIAHPVTISLGAEQKARYCGLFLELKREGEKLHPGPRSHPCNRFKSIDGEEYRTEHLREQADVLAKLRQRGYVAEFAVGFDDAKSAIDNYLGERI